MRSLAGWIHLGRHQKDNIGRMPSASGSSRRTITAPAPTPVGRPRDPSVEQRVFTAAVAVYDEEGWAGFTFDAVAARARVGKSAIYRRWGSKERLLSEALAARTRDVTKVDTGSLRGDLVQLVDQMLENYTARHGLVTFRLLVDAPRNALLEAGLEARLAQHGAEFDDVFARAVERGELPDHRRDRDLHQAVSGATMHRVITTPAVERAGLRRHRRSVADEIVDFALGAVERGVVPDRPT
jgi:AcrR family transcriptional regulator